LQAGSPLGMPWPALLSPVLLGVASNILTALPDAPADVVVGKRTFPVRRGEAHGRVKALVFITVAGAAPLFGHRDMRDAWFLGGSAVAAVLVALAASQIGRADAANRRACLMFVLLAGAAIQALFVGWTGALF